ncbi:hypothetical protein GCM10010425_39510 [Streptomyces spororaveus]|uniref:Uncharacterized protein n=1 Tax=Streptomyces spororaveus TaxID=284039 RepID=A0ABQ3TPY2_9ACTN|nr:hypothetical protein Sspor_80420 [Streptomyces spororaveus]
MEYAVQGPPDRAHPPASDPADQLEPSVDHVPWRTHGARLGQWWTRRPALRGIPVRRLLPRSEGTVQAERSYDWSAVDVLGASGNGTAQHGSALVCASLSS